MSIKEKVEKLVSNIYAPGPSYQFVINLSTFSFDFISEEIKGMVYEGSDLYSPRRVLHYVHPQDRSYHLHCQRIIKYFFYNVLEPLQIHHYKLSFQCRVKIDSEYRMILHQIIPMKLDKSADQVKALGNLSDISHITTTSNNRISIIGFNGKPSCFDVSHKNDLEYLLNKVATYTKREIEVLQLLSNGYSTKQIGSKLNISGDTVRTHRKNILSKSDYKNTVHAVSTAIREGII